jgi:hypothetical protein
MLAGFRPDFASSVSVDDECLQFGDAKSTHTKAGMYARTVDETQQMEFNHGSRNKVNSLCRNVQGLDYHARLYFPVSSILGASGCGNRWT